MDDKPASSLTKKFKENTGKILSSPAEDNGEKLSLGQACTPVEIKEEDSTDEIQEYAAITMSELLGWYGYNKVDSDCTRSLNLDHFTSLPYMKNNQILQMKPTFISNKQKPKSPISFNATNLPFHGLNLPLTHSANNLTTMGGQILSSPLSLKKGTVDFTTNGPYNFSSSTCSGDAFCSWCGQTTETCKSEKTNSVPCNTINTLGHFCSDACFAAGRRAVFKRAKTCNWCRHIKNPISYVDFQDGESQLQFCSDKCLNQYKMNIFCHETRTHLMLHGLNTVSYHDTEKGNLITPELWFRNCQSPVASPTENKVADEHMTSDLSSSHKDKTKEKEQDETEKSIESTKKITKTGDSFCIQLCTKANNCNGNRKNVHTEINENDINERNKKQNLINEDNKFCHFLNNQTHCAVDCSQQNTLSCNNFTKNCNLINVINYDSHSHEHNNVFFRRNIHVKDIRILQQEKKDTLSENTVGTSHPFANTSASTIEHETPLSSECFTDKFNQAKYRKQTNISSRTSPLIQSEQTESSVRALPTSLLPPVTVLVPYPIPVPIPIPIPVPIPTPILNKLMVDEQKIPTNIKDTKYKNPKCNESIENKCSMLQESQLCTNTNISVTEEPQRATSTKLCVSLSSSSINNENNNIQSFKCNAKPPRKRKHLNENINYERKEPRLKKRNKFITA
ncbi:sine oculis-binding protein [Nomia melanderi]|uniref:sine oculis-binding protein n=1 Tax=Nomia melanderi TaxID=2448451 RepID=UPI001304669D|nr:uncharacterized protein LOC116423899 [Nomia melanderi]XP_031825495.1 uncharacterized protein LOC116423899 [Nomia melanderi]XP_031825506.1 uncharacterized protein LOC116423899 [Nomia melanderi]XP_031825515.1 uncharacterized protein LOC116423899 [Nomia melanderi]